ncbi:hypothetical protein LL050_004106, partial [Providencia rettgeri]
VYSLSFSEENKYLLVKELLDTERNFILSKNQTTMQLEQIKLDYKESKNLLEIINSLIKSK